MVATSIPRTMFKYNKEFFTLISINVNIGTCVNDDSARNAAKSLGYNKKIIYHITNN